MKFWVRGVLARICKSVFVAACVVFLLVPLLIPVLLIWLVSGADVLDWAEERCKAIDKWWEYR